LRALKTHLAAIFPNYLQRYRIASDSHIREKILHYVAGRRRISRIAQKREGKIYARKSCRKRRAEVSG